MKLSKTCWHARLWMLHYDRQLPTNLCPYFWTLLPCFLTFIPLSLIFLPMHLIELMEKKKWNIDEGYFSIQLIVVLVLDGIFFIGFSMIAMIFVNINTEFGLLLMICGIIGWALFCIIVINYFYSKLKEGKVKVKKEKTPNIFFEFVKAKYKKYCPKIDWK